ncbi:MAG TPA: tRNA pseudouridine(54/55) synthase Pus10 [archaeon]|nr:tRNA pseudouridine(54/55) synthase Pus10 [archaeon]
MIPLLQKILEANLCDSCLGRQFGQLLSGYTNSERGKFLRAATATAIDGRQLPAEKINPNNFFGFKFRQNTDFEKLPKEKIECELCYGLFNNLDKTAKRISNSLGKYEYSTFLIGTNISRKLLDAEEKLWERCGIDYCEPMRAELNRELGKRVEKFSGKKADLKKPDIAVLLDMEANKVWLNVNPLFIFGYYQKLQRGFPQCKWGTPHKYKTSVEEQVGLPALKLTLGRDHKFHGAGREDIDARCLAWRPFVLEIATPKIRKIDLRKLEKLASRRGKIKIKSLKFSNMETVREIKAAAVDKTYRALVQLKKSISKKDLKKLSALRGTISQRTPERVLHRRADLHRKREVLSIRAKLKGKKTLELVIKGSAGLYIKELISGDNGRTRPSVSEVLGTEAKCKELDVVGIGRIENPSSQKN